MVGPQISQIFTVVLLRGGDNSHDSRLNTYQIGARFFSCGFTTSQVEVGGLQFYCSNQLLVCLGLSIAIFFPAGQIPRWSPMRLLFIWGMGIISMNNTKICFSSKQSSSPKKISIQIIFKLFKSKAPYLIISHHISMHFFVLFPSLPR